MLTLEFKPFEPDTLPPKEVILVLLKECASTKIANGCVSDHALTSCRVFPAIPVFAKDTWKREYLRSLIFISPARVWAWEQPELSAKLANLPESDPYWEGEWGPNHPNVYRARTLGNIDGERILEFCAGWAAIPSPSPT